MPGAGTSGAGSGAGMSGGAIGAGGGARVGGRKSGPRGAPKPSGPWSFAIGCNYDRTTATIEGTVGTDYSVRMGAETFSIAFDCFHTGSALIDPASQGIGVAQEQQRQPGEHGVYQGMPRRMRRVLLRHKSL